MIPCPAAVPNRGSWQRNRNPYNVRTAPVLYGTGAVLHPKLRFRSPHISSPHSHILSTRSYFAPSFYEVLPFRFTSEILKGSYFL